MRAIAASAAASSRRTSGAGNCGAKSVRLKERLDPLEAPLQRPHNPIFIARGEPVSQSYIQRAYFSLNMWLASSLPAPAPPLTGINNEPDRAQNVNQCDNGERDNAIETPDAEYVALDMSQVKSERQARERARVRTAR